MNMNNNRTDMICPHCNKRFLPGGNVYECPNINGNDADTHDLDIYVVACCNCHKVVSIVKW